MHQERRASGFAQMETLAQYREFAAECYRLASEAETEADRKTLLEIAQAWEEHLANLLTSDPGLNMIKSELRAHRFAEPASLPAGHREHRQRDN
jgi:hypothetical protein